MGVAAAWMGLEAKRCGQNRLGKLHSCEVAVWENTLGKLPLGKSYWEVQLTSFRIGSCLSTVKFSLMKPIQFKTTVDTLF